MPGFGMLSDRFDAGVLDPARWPASYGDPVVQGGRLRVPCTTGYAACASASVYRLADAQVACRAYPPAVGGAVAEALAEILVITAVGGTDAGFSLNAATGQLRLVTRVGYADPGEVVLSYSPTVHAWVRLRDGDGFLYWDTSPDGVTWTTRRTAAAPAWTADSDLGVILAGHRDSGPDGVAEFDSFNITRPGRLGAASRTGAVVAPLQRRGPTLSGG